MYTLLFISGKNWKLSLAEITSFLEARKINFEVLFFSNDFFTLRSDENIDASIIADLGGTIKIGNFEAKISSDIVKEAFLQKTKEAQTQISKIIEASGLVDKMAKQAAGKVFFGVSVYCTEKQLRPLSGIIQRFIGSAIKDELAGYGKKSQFMGFSKDRRLAQLSHVEVLKKKLVENKSEVLFCIGRETSWVATTIAVHNPFEFQKRDIYKPRQRKIFGMPPRLAKIMVNLSFCSPEKVLLDPFCGVGTVLQEALLARATVVGVDINPWCIKAAEENLEWIKREYNIEDADFRVVQGDVGMLAKKIGLETVDCIATEPDLGPALRQVPTTPYARKIIEKLEPLFFGFINEAYKVLKKEGHLVLVTPYIITRSGQSVTMPIGEKAETVGFKRVYPFSKEMFAEDAFGQDDLLGLASLVEVDERHKIGREIHVFKK
jgi:tRNA G10  N-methylase Trm11